MINTTKIKEMFMNETIIDCLKYYESVIDNKEKDFWDWVILTSSNDKQLKSYNEEIRYRKEHGLLPLQAKYLVISDPLGKRVGSGGATLNAIKIIKENDNRNFDELKILIIHSGGDSKRIPQYSTCGKIFSPVQRSILHNMSSSLFDEFMIAFSSIPCRMSPGILMLSGDVLLAFNPSQVELHHIDSAAISIKEDANIGCNHGVFVSNKENIMTKFLHKQSVESLKKNKAINEHNCVDIDTGAIYFNYKIVNKLYSLVDTKDKINSFISDKTRISLYADFVYPLSLDSTLDNYLKEIPEGDFSSELLECRKLIWNELHNFKLKVIKTSPSKFIHFGTTNELSKNVVKNIKSFNYLTWKRNVMSNLGDDIDFCVNNSYIENKNSIGKNCYIENSYIGKNVKVGNNSIISYSYLNDTLEVPNDVCINTIKIENNKFVTRIYSIYDNPKECKNNDLSFLNTNLLNMQKKYNILDSNIWKTNDKSMWNANFYVVSDTEEESILNALTLYNIIYCKEDIKVVNNYFNNKRISLCDSFNKADDTFIIKRKELQENLVRKQKYIDMISNGEEIKTANKILLDSSNINFLISNILKDIDNYENKIKYRIYLSLSILTNYIKIEGYDKNKLEDLCYEKIKEQICEKIDNKNTNFNTKNKSNIKLPIRVNFAGGWSDTPPYCIENGGAVINAAFKLNGQLPISVSVEKINNKSIILESIDLGSSMEFTNINDLKICTNTDDPFSILKASLITTGIVRFEDNSILDVIKRLGGGLKFTTYVTSIPKGSGLGISSILSGACLKVLYDFLNIKISDEEICMNVLYQEQLMATGGGWQDQIGGIIPGFKFTTTDIGVQKFDIEQLNLDKKFINEFNNRYALIYTGQRRLAKNLLRSIMNNYILNDKKTLDILNDIKMSAYKMKNAFLKNDINLFINELNNNWELAKKLDSGCTNICIDQILNSCDDLVDAKMMCGAGGGGFLQVFLKEGISKKELENRINEIFQDCGVKVYDATLF